MHKYAILVVCSLLGSILAQSSSNPAGTPYFSPSAVRELPLNTTISSVLLNTTGYAEFYSLWVPPNIGEIQYILRTPETCSNYIEIAINFVAPNADLSVGYPCPTGSSSYFCDQADYQDEILASTNNELNFTVDISSFRPGQYQYITLYQFYSSAVNCNYTIRAEPTFQCEGSARVPGINSSHVLSCWDPINVTASGQNFTGNATFLGQIDVYRIDVPKNVTMIWAWVVTSMSVIDIMTTGGYVSTSLTPSDGYGNIGANYGSTTDWSYPMYNVCPFGDFPVFFSLKFPSYLGAYNISFHWSYCGPDKAGIGVYSTNWTLAETVFSIPNCNDNVVSNNINLLAGTNSYTFNLPPYNSSSDTYYAAQYAYMSVPAGAVGAINITCTTNGSNAFIGLTKNGLAACYGGSDTILDCGATTLALLSQDLFMGGVWSVAACNAVSAPGNTVVTLHIEGSVALPSASPMPGSTPSASPSSTGSDSQSASCVVLPSLLLAVSIAILCL